jgi:hypothetical protein
MHPWIAWLPGMNSVRDMVGRFAQNLHELRRHWQVGPVAELGDDVWTTYEFRPVLTCSDRGGLALVQLNDQSRQSDGKAQNPENNRSRVPKGAAKCTEQHCLGSMTAATSRNAVFRL